MEKSFKEFPPGDNDKSKENKEKINISLKQIGNDESKENKEKINISLKQIEEELTKWQKNHFLSVFANKMFNEINNYRRNVDSCFSYIRSNSQSELNTIRDIYLEMKGLYEMIENFQIWSKEKEKNDNNISELHSELAKSLCEYLIESFYKLIFNGISSEIYQHRKRLLTSLHDKMLKGSDIDIQNKLFRVINNKDEVYPGPRLSILLKKINSILAKIKTADIELDNSNRIKSLEAEFAKFKQQREEDMQRQDQKAKNMLSTVLDALESHLTNTNHSPSLVFTTTKKLLQLSDSEEPDEQKRPYSPGLFVNHRGFGSESYENPFQKKNIVDTTGWYNDEDIDLVIKSRVKYNPNHKFLIETTLDNRSTFLLPAVNNKLLLWFIDKRQQELPVNEKLDDRKDVFDDISNLLKLSTKGSAVILFPYNINNNHWICVDIRITKKSKHNYKLDFFAHDPFGGGKLEEEIFKQLRDTMKRKIDDMHDSKISFQAESHKSPYNMKRQSDTSSCGVIAVEELIEIAINNSLINVIYEQNAMDLRRKHQQNIEKFFGLNSVEYRKFMERHAKILQEPIKPSFSS